jgi:hypothetical protein
MEPWFDGGTAGIVGGLIGAGLGTAGGIIGGLSGLCIRKGWKTLVYGLFITVITLSLALLITGVVALLSGQPYYVILPFAFPGLLGMVIFGGLFPVLRKVITLNELRQMQAKDI